MLSEENRHNILFRLTALWGLVESGLGGFLHAFKIPFSGIILHGFSVSILTFIFFYSKSPVKTILTSFLQVAIIKILLSPHTPPTAYLAICFQAFLSILVYSIFSINWFSIFFVTLISFLESAFQKVITLTVFYGMNLWGALDIFVNKTLLKIFNLKIFNGSIYLLGFYFTIYSISVLLVLILIFRLWKNNNRVTDHDLIDLKELYGEFDEPIKFSSNNKIYYFVFILLFIISVFTYFVPEHNNLYFVLGYLLRTLVILIFWFVVLIPLANQMISHFLKSQLDRRQTEIDKFIEYLPKLKKHLYFIWLESTGMPTYKRIIRLTSQTFILVLYSK